MPLLLRVEPDVFEENDASRVRTGARGLHLGPDAVVQKGHLRLEPLLEHVDHRFECVLVLLVPVRPPEVRAEDDRLCPLRDAVLDGRQRAHDTRRVRDGTVRVLGNIEVAPKPNTEKQLNLRKFQPVNRRIGSQIVPFLIRFTSPDKDPLVLDGQLVQRELVHERHLDEEGHGDGKHEKRGQTGRGEKRAASNNKFRLQFREKRDEADPMKGTQGTK